MPSYSQYKRQMAVMDADDANIETWITVKGNHIPIMKGQSKEEAVQSFLEKKGKSSGGSKSSSGEKPAFRELKGTKHQGGTIGLSKEEHNAIEKQNKEARRVYRDAKSGKAAREANARPILKADENADVSDIVKQYKADMKALGENASAAKQNKVEVNAIKEFMRRKVGAGHPYEDYYNYWLRGMSKNDSDAFNSIYGESENREKAFEALSNEKEKPANKVSQSLKDDVDYYFTENQANKKSSERWNKIREDVISKRGEGVLKDIKKVQKTGYYTPNEILNALEDGKKFDDMVSNAKPANKGWQNARSSHPETIGKVVRRVVKKIGEARNKNND